ncbi:MAG: extracellular solute-binding protein [Eubacteriales bacterium]|nr:extracellular solute-binding protein [Eubacteriales bacterium]
MKKVLALVLTLVLAFGCTSAFAAASIEVETTYTDANLDVVTEIAKAFTAETGIEVELIAPGSEYETVMKTRMSSGDLPDVWETHGWAVKRYSEYLASLNDQPWVSRMDPSAASIVTAEDGTIYGCNLTQSMGGCIYNIDVLTEAGVDPAAIHSLQDFYDACEKIKAIGKVPVYIGGKDSGNCAGFMAAIASAMLTAKGNKYDQGAALLDGSFDWETYGTYVMQEVANMVNNGYINTDFTTADTMAQCTAVGAGDCGFLWRHAQNITWARQYVPDANLGFMPYPSFSGEGMAFMAGEAYCLGINKETEKKEEAAKYLEFVSRPENIEKMCRATGALPGFTDVTVEGDYAIDAFRKAQEMYADVVEYTNLFDRQYFPNGMWGVMGESITMVVMDPTETGIAAAVENLKVNYQEKKEADGK